MNKQPDYTINIPHIFFDVEYKSERIPGIHNQSNLSLGANCQVFAYALLDANGITIPNFRSSELWDDVTYTKRVLEFKPLDIMLYSANGNAFGAHIGVYIGDGEIIHLSLENGKAEIISHSSMLENKKYRIFVGAKRASKLIN